MTDGPPGRGANGPVTQRVAVTPGRRGAPGATGAKGPTTQRNPVTPGPRDPAGNTGAKGPTTQRNPVTPGPRGGPGITGVILLPGLALWRRTPVVGALLFISGVIAPCFAVLMVLQHLDDLVGLFTRPNVLRGTAIVALAALTSRMIAVFLTADRVPDATQATFMRRRGTVAVVLLAVPTTFAVMRMEETRSVVRDVFKEDASAGQVTAPQDTLAAEYRTVLMLGSDEGNDRLGLRTDTMIIAMIHQRTGHTVLVSVPRNLSRLQFPPDSAMGKKFPNGFDDLINAVYEEVDTNSDLKRAYTDGVSVPGIRALMEGLSYSLGITIDDYVMVNSCAFVQVVDAVGGVTIEVDKKLPMPAKLRCSNYTLPRTIGPGTIYMDGTKALGYVRSRKADSDYQRMERQRTLLQQIAKQIGITTLLTSFNDLADAVKDNVDTSMTVTEARTLLSFLQNDNGEFKSVGLVPPIVEPGEPDYASLQAYVRQLRVNIGEGLDPPVVEDPTGGTGSSTSDTTEGTDPLDTGSAG